MALTVGTLVVEMRADTARLTTDLSSAKASVERTMDDMKDAVRSAKEVFEALGVAMVGVGFGEFIKSTIEAADQINKASQKAGVAVEQFAALSYAAQLADVSQEDLGTSLKKLNVALVEAGKSGSQQAEIFKALGVSTRDASGNILPANEVLEALAGAFSNLPDGALKADAAVKLFGKTGTAMIPLLNEGKMGVKGLEDQYASFGGISKETAEKAELFNDNLKRMKQNMIGLVNEVLPPLLDGITKLQELLGYKQEQKDSIFYSDVVLQRIKDVQAAIADLNLSRNGTLLNPFPDQDKITAQIAHERELVAKLVQDYNGALNAEQSYRKAAEKPIDKVALGGALAGKDPGADSTLKWATEQAIQLQKQLGEAGFQATQSVRTDYEKLGDQVDIYRGQLANGVITQDTFNRLIVKAGEDFAGTGKDMELWAKDQAESAKGFMALMDSLYPNESAAKKYLQDYQLLAQYLEGPELKMASDILGQNFAQAGQENADEIEQIYKDTATAIRNDFSTAFQNIFDHGIKGFGGFVQAIESTFKRMLAEMATLAIANPIIVPAVAALGGASGISAQAQNAVLRQLGSSALGASSFGASAATTSSAFMGGAQAGFTGGFGAANTAATGAIGTGATGTASGIGAYVGAAMPYAIAAAAIIYGNQLTGHKDVAGVSTMGTAALGAAIGTAILPGIGTAIGAVAGVVFSAAFGTGAKANYAPTQIAGQFSGAGFSGNLQTPWSKKGGWFSGGDSGTEVAQLSATQQAGFSAMVGGTKKAFDDLSRVAGDGTKSLDGWTYAAKQNIATADDQKQLLIDLANSMGAFLAPQIVALQQAGESLGDTALRLKDEFATTDRALVVIGKDSTAAFGAAGLASAALRDQLVTTAGGMSNLASVVQGYYTSMFSSTDQLSMDMKSLDQAFHALGITTPASEDAFKALVNAQDLTTQSGQQMFISLMQLAPAFSKVTDAATSAIDTLYQTAQTALQQFKLLDSTHFTTRTEYYRYLYQAKNAGITAANDVLPGTASSTYIPGQSDLTAYTSVVTSIDQLRAEVKAGQIAIATYTQQTTRILNQWNGDGMPAQRTA